MMAEDLNLIFEENRCATYGRPKIRDVNITVGRPGTAPVNRPKGQSDHLPSLDKAEMEQLKKDLNLKKELYESKVPLKWACSNLGPVESSYGAAYGANMPELRRYILEADKQKVSRMRPLGLGPTLGFGGVDPLIYQHKTTAFPVAGCFTQPLRPSSDVDLLKLTTYEVLHGMSAPKTRANLTAEEREALAKLAAIEAIRMRESQDRVKRSYIPLGSSAMHNQSDPKTMNQTMFCSYPEEAYMRALKADSATRMKRAFTGATASVAACAPAQGTNLATSELLTRRTRGE